MDVNKSDFRGVLLSRTVPEGEKEGRKELSADKALQETPGREPKSARNHAVSLGAHTAARDGRAKALTSMRTAATLAQMQA